MLKKISLTLFFLCIFSILVLSISAIPGNGSFTDINNGKQILGNPFESSLSRSRLVLVKSIVDYGSISIDRYVEPTFPDIIYSNSHFYSVFIPGVAIFAIPFYVLGEQINLGVLFTYLLESVAVILVAILEYQILRKLNFSIDIALLTTFLTVFATGLYTYSTSLNAHPLSALAVTLAAYATVLILKSKNWLLGYPLIWLSFGMGIVTDYPNLITILPFFILAFASSVGFLSRENKKILRMNSFFIFSVLFSLPFLIPLFIYVNQLFGTYFTTIEPHQVQGYIDQGKTILSLNTDPTFFLNHQIVYKKLSLSPGYTLPGLYTLLFSLPRSIFVFTPLYLFALLGTAHIFRKEKVFALACIFSIVSTILLYSSYTDYAGGWAYGPRFLVGIAPIFGIFLAFAIKKYLWRKLYLVAFLILSTASLAISTLGALTSRIAPGSPLEGSGWGWSSSFVKNIPLIGNEPYTSFVYDQYLFNFISKSEFFYTILLIIIIIFFILAMNSYRANWRYDEKSN